MATRGSSVPASPTSSPRWHRRRSFLTAEEIIDTEDIRHNPGLTKIPYYVVDAVVHAPFGGYPGETPGHYSSDSEHVGEVFLLMHSGKLREYLDKWVYSVADEREMLEKRVGSAKLDRLRLRSMCKARDSGHDLARSLEPTPRRRRRSRNGNSRCASPRASWRTRAPTGWPRAGDRCTRSCSPAGSTRRTRST